MIRLTQPELVQDKKQQESSSPDDVKKEADVGPVTTQGVDKASSGTETGSAPQPFVKMRLVEPHLALTSYDFCFYIQWTSQQVNPRLSLALQATLKSWANHQSRLEVPSKSLVPVLSSNGCPPSWTTTIMPSPQCR